MSTFPPPSPSLSQVPVRLSPFSRPERPVLHRLTSWGVDPGGDPFSSPSLGRSREGLLPFPEGGRKAFSRSPPPFYGEGTGLFSFFPFPPTDGEACFLDRNAHVHTVRSFPPTRTRLVGFFLPLPDRARPFSLRAHMRMTTSLPVWRPRSGYDVSFFFLSPRPRVLLRPRSAL